MALDTHVAGGVEPTLAVAAMITAWAPAAAVVFAVIQVVPAAGDAYRVVWGWLAAPLAGTWPPPLARHVADPTDLLTLPALAGAWWLGVRRARQHERHTAAVAPTPDAAVVTPSRGARRGP